MTSKLNRHCARWLLAVGLAAGVATANAASGFNVTKDQEALIAPGMSTVEVQSALGRPAHNVRYANEPGRTWTYRTIGSTETVFDVDFGADGRVAAVSERGEGE
jgi:outer membrane protein assembly factor BamE (lipoprotein component of BamABCDE complex)